MSDLYKSLAKFQQEVPIIHKATEGYGYTYASLDLIIRTINPFMKKNNLGFTQLLDGTKIKTIIFHSESGETLESSVDVPQGVVLKGMNEFQVLGSAITYLKRYSLGSMLGLITDKDIDASGSQLEPNGFEHPNIDPYAEGDELRKQVVNAIISEALQVGENIVSDDLKNESIQSLKDTFEYYVNQNTERKAKEWIDKQMTMPKKSGSVEALTKLKQEALSRKFMTTYVSGELKKKYEEINA